MMHGSFGFLLVHVLTWLAHNAHGSQIINGKNVPENEMQYMVSVQTNNGHACGGFLVSEEFVLTAAHCGTKLTHVVLGTHNLNKVDNNTRRKIVKQFKPNTYNATDLRDDIMLLKLAQKAKLRKGVTLINLPTHKKLVKDKQICRVAGWGFTKSGDKSVNVLKAVDVPIVKHKVCMEEWKSVNVKLPANVICAGGYNTNKGFCQGDSGGPLVCDKVAVGIVSFNFRKNCSYPNAPNIYTDISKHINWIKNILKTKKC